jgi:hypothetical protein
MNFPIFSHCSFMNFHAKLNENRLEITSKVSLPTSLQSQQKHSKNSVQQALIEWVKSLIKHHVSSSLTVNWIPTKPRWLFNLQKFLKMMIRKNLWIQFRGRWVSEMTSKDIKVFFLSWHFRTVDLDRHETEKTKTHDWHQHHDFYCFLQVNLVVGRFLFARSSSCWNSQSHGIRWGLFSWDPNLNSHVRINRSIDAMLVVRRMSSTTVYSPRRFRASGIWCVEGRTSRVCRRRSSC